MSVDMQGKKIFIIPDAQVKDGVDTSHILAAGRYIIDKQPEVVVCLGDFWDMPSLSSYEKVGSKSFEGRRYKNDIDSGNNAMRILLSPLNEYNEAKSRHKEKKYKPRMVFLMGNHENRIGRAINDNPAHLDGIIGYSDLDLQGWEQYEYQEIVDIEGILFSHNFVNPYSLTKNVVAGTIDNKLQRIGNSFVMGHQQVLQFGTRHLSSGKQMLGIVAGAYYSHDEAYMGLQGNHHWRGCVVLHDTKDGYGDPMFLSLEYIKRKYL